MLVPSLTTRSVQFGFLFGPPRLVNRQEASAVYDKLCEQLRLDDFTFKYESASDLEAPRSQGFKIHLQRNEGRGFFAVTVDMASIQRPIRLLVQYEWPPSLEHVCERCDLANAAVFEALQGSWQKVHAEVRLRAHCNDKRKNALAFFREQMLKAPGTWLDSLGAPLDFASCKFSTAGRGPVAGPLDSPIRELSIEVLLEDRSCLYFELVSKWTQVPTGATAATGIDGPSLRPFTAKPSEYIGSEHEFLRDRLTQLSASLG